MNWLDRNREVNRRRDVLERIVTILFLLAALADRAAGLAQYRRPHVLDALACGEAEARAFVIGLAGAPVDGDVAMQDSAALGYAERIAVSFRVLALVLDAMLAQTRRSALAGGRHAVLPLAHLEPAGSARTRPPFWALPAPDTS